MHNIGDCRARNRTKGTSVDGESVIRGVSLDLLTLWNCLCNFWKRDFPVITGGFGRFLVRKESLCTLSFPEYRQKVKKPIVYSNARNIGIGDVLSQTQVGQKRLEVLHETCPGLKGKTTGINGYCWLLWRYRNTLTNNSTNKSSSCTEATPLWRG